MRTCACMFVCAPVYVRVCARAHVCVCAHVLKSVSVCECVRKCVCVCARARARGMKAPFVPILALVGCDALQAMARTHRALLGLWDTGRMHLHHVVRTAAIASDTDPHWPSVPAATSVTA